MLQKLWLKVRLWWNGPEADILSDYETLVRLARRCAYDFAHAVDYVKLPAYLSDLDYSARANMWISLFAKGNPGKDYRLRYMMELDQADNDRKTLFEIIKEHGLEKEVSAHLRDRCDDIPF